MVKLEINTISYCEQNLNYIVISLVVSYNEITIDDLAIGGSQHQHIILLLIYFSSFKLLLILL